VQTSPYHWPQSAIKKDFSMSDRLATRCYQRSSLVAEFHEKQQDVLMRVGRRMTDNFTQGGRLICAGQGLFQTVAQHMATCFAYQLDFERPLLPAIALGNPLMVSALLAARQTHECLAREYRLYRGEDHLLVIFCTAQPSAEIKQLAEQIEDRENLVIIGPEGANKLLSNTAGIQQILVPGDSFAALIELSMLATHLLCELVEGELFGV